MTTSEERMQILKLIESGQISAKEGAKLLRALGDTPSEAEPAREVRGRWFRVRVTDLQTGKSKANVTIPLSLVDVGMKLGARFAPGVEAVEMEDLRAAITQGVIGKLLDVEDEEDGERVEIFVE